jgi:hypothetical protein
MNEFRMVCERRASCPGETRGGSELVTCHGIITKRSMGNTRILYVGNVCLQKCGEDLSELTED